MSTAAGGGGEADKSGKSFTFPEKNIDLLIISLFLMKYNLRLFFFFNIIFFFSSKSSDKLLSTPVSGTRIVGVEEERSGVTSSCVLAERSIEVGMTSEGTDWERDVEDVEESFIGVVSECVLRTWEAGRWEGTRMKEIRWKWIEKGYYYVWFDLKLVRILIHLFHYTYVEDEAE